MKVLLELNTELPFSEVQHLVQAGINEFLQDDAIACSGVFPAPPGANRVWDEAAVLAVHGEMDKRLVLVGPMSNLASTEFVEEHGGVAIPLTEPAHTWKIR